MALLPSVDGGNPVLVTPAPNDIIGTTQTTAGAAAVTAPNLFQTIQAGGIKTVVFLGMVYFAYKYLRRK